MSKLLQLIRVQRIRQQPPGAVFVMSWKRPDNRPGRALGLKQQADESDEEFLDRLRDEAIRTGVRFVFIDYLAGEETARHHSH
jgi:hypothetical protein